MHGSLTVMTQSEAPDQWEADAQRTFTEAEIAAVADEILGSEPPENGVFAEAWQRIGTTALRVGQRLKIIDSDGEERNGSVVHVEDELSDIHFDGDEEPSRIDSNRLMQARNYAIEHRLPGGIIAGTASVSIAALYVITRSRRK